MPHSLAQKLKTDVYELCQPEGRMVGTDGHRVAEKWVRERLKSAGCEPYRGNVFDLPYRCEGIEFVNFAGVVPGIDRELPPLLVGAHYDSVIAAPCADDNGAAVAIVSALADEFCDGGSLNRDLIVAIFDAEEPPYFCGPEMGSIRFYEDQLDERGVHFAMIFDLVGHDVSIPGEMVPLLGSLPGMSGKDLPLPLLRSLLFMTGAESHPELSRIVEDAGLPKGLRLVATLNEYVGDMSDHGIFRQNGVPYVFFSCGRWQHYHCPTDTPDRLNYTKMDRIARLAKNIVVAMDREPLEPTPSANDDPTLEYEIQTLKRGLGLAYPFLLKHLGISELQTREDLSRVVSSFLSLGI